VIYDPATGTLWTSDGTFLKYLYCPKSVRWNDLGVTRQEHPESHAVALERSRDCSHCKSRVSNLDGLTDEQVAAVFEKEPDACVYLRTDWANVTVLKSVSPFWLQMPKWPTPRGRVEGTKATLSDAMHARITDATPRVHTGRTLEQINAAAAQGFRILLKQASDQQRSTACGYNLEIWQHDSTGEIMQCVDLRSRPDGHRGGADADQWHQVLRLEHVYPHTWPNPYAAYLVSRDLSPGALVVLTDPIEDIVGYRHWGTYRACSVPATWTGSDFRVHADDVEVPQVVG
jgi:hypothetical protein